VGKFKSGIQEFCLGPRNEDMFGDLHSNRYCIFLCSCKLSLCESCALHKESHPHWPRKTLEPFKASLQHEIITVPTLSV